MTNDDLYTRLRTSAAVILDDDHLKGVRSVLESYLNDQLGTQTGTPLTKELRDKAVAAFKQIDTILGGLK